MTVSEMLDRYMEQVTPRKRSADTELARLRKLQKDELGGVKLSKLTPAMIAEYRDRRGTAVAAGTVHRELGLLSHAIDIACREWGVSLHKNPVAVISKPRLANARTRRLQSGEWERLGPALAASRNRLLLPIVRFALATAMRRGEILNLEWENISLAKRTAHIPQTKTGKPRTIPLSPAAIAILVDLSADRRMVFDTTANALKLAWVRAASRADLSNFRFHDLRHEAISRLFELGLSLPEVALISGHRDPRMLMRYTHLEASRLADKLAAICVRQALCS